jgi:hypothetical protein
MATATLTYDLNDPNDRMAHYRATISMDMAMVLWEYDQHLRSEYKYGDKEDAYDYREKFREFLNERNIDLDKIVG